MPEGHTLHRLARDQQELVGHRVAASSPQGRFPAGTVDGRVLDEVEAWGKHLLQHFDGVVVHTHLGMRGITLRSSPPVPPKPQVRLRLEATGVAWDLIAPSRCDVLDPAAAGALLAGLGPDPLRPDADAARLRSALGSDDRALGTALLDQSVVAGLGNVLRAEVLHSLGLHPRRPASSLDDVTVARLWETARTVMEASVAAGSIVTRPPDGRFVYKQEACGACGAPVEAFDLGGRRAYACPSCQAA
jgi:endonuclease VIII